MFASKARMALRSPGTFTSQSTTSPGRSTRPSFTRTVVQFGRITPNSSHLTQLFAGQRLRRAPSESARFLWLRPGFLQSNLGGLGKQGLSGRHGNGRLRHRKGNCGSREARRRWLVLRRYLDRFHHRPDDALQGGDFPVRAPRNSPASTATTNISETTSPNWAIRGKTKRSGRSSHHSIRSKYHHARVVHGRQRKTGTSPSSVASRCIRRLKPWGARRN